MKGQADGGGEEEAAEEEGACDRAVPSCNRRRDGGIVKVFSEWEGGGLDGLRGKGQGTCISAIESESSGGNC